MINTYERPEDTDSLRVISRFAEFNPVINNDLGILELYLLNLYNEFIPLTNWVSSNDFTSSPATNQ